MTRIRCTENEQREQDLEKNDPNKYHRIPVVDTAFRGWENAESESTSEGVAWIKLIL